MDRKASISTARRAPGPGDQENAQHQNDPDKILRACRHAARVSGKIDLTAVLKNISEGPEQAAKVQKLIGEAKNQIIKMSPQEGLAYLATSGRTAPMSLTEEGYRARKCEARPKCPVCADLVKPSGHRARGKACASARKRIKPGKKISLTKPPSRGGNAGEAMEVDQESDSSRHPSIVSIEPGLSAYGPTNDVIVTS
ncbi:hypothetical protein DBV15_12414 [Temnothorax longispinosus]|uniref:Uncharacterized protein n=1 Tax=Temnothorax longispinosus TaxID=300112 RepID=A0A4S2L4H8_9HYME|nr:hypothetical protein DBV15_12414 [Temnothorax longispinosus]